ncbi:MAG: nuclear transport factor 2 family protein [Gammaproteobacteria bacterium]|nr:nuclear transport factor 2 family protein [Gammaproteobacteria bacterium]
MNTELPEPVVAYLAAEKRKDSAALAQCFDDAAIVRDEGREHRGAAAIEAWHRETNAKVSYVVEPLDASVNNATVIVRTRVSGDFLGSPAELRNHFTLNGDHIALLELKP